MGGVKTNVLRKRSKKKHGTAASLRVAPPFTTHAWVKRASRRHRVKHGSVLQISAWNSLNGTSHQKETTNIMAILETPGRKGQWM